MESNKKNEKFINKSINKFKDKYSYELINYINNTSLVKIKCNKHNIIFEQTPSEHLRGYKKCVLCGGKIKTLNDFLLKAKNKHGNKYDYSLVNYVDCKTKVTIICPKHGEFEQLSNGHFKSGCQKCFLEFNNINETLNDFLLKAKNKHGNKYDYSKVNYINSQTKVTIICSKHGEFEQLPYNHVRGKGCNKCGVESTKSKLVLTHDDFIYRSDLTHNNKYDYSKVNYINSQTKVTIICSKHGEFEQLPYDHLSGHGCNKCTSSISSHEIEINDFINNILKLKTVTSSRTIIKPQQLDIYIPSKKIAIEFNGLYWHSEFFIDKNYHLNKTQECEKQGIQLIHIFEDEWLYKKNIVKSRLKNILGLTENKIFGRKCKVKKIENKISREFFNNNHLQGYTNSSIKLGLYYNDELISMMLFSKPRLGVGGKYDGYELTRFCNKLNTNVLGGASKLFKYFINNYNFNEIISYADRRWGQGSLYNMLDFTKDRINRPNYWYIIGKKRLHRFGFRKDVLIREGFDKNKTERQIMLNRKIYRIYDCGTITFSYKKNP